jgi:hypothetical protein
VVSELGFSFSSQFTDENATCMVVSDDIYVMLLVEPFFMSFTNKDIVDATKSTEVILALEVDSRERVDELVDKALTAGGQSGSFTAGMDGVDAPSLLLMMLLNTRDCVRSKEHPVVAFAGVVDARSWTVRIIASSEDDGVHAEGGKVLVQPGSIEGTPARFPDSDLVRAEVLHMACDESGRVEIRRVGETEFWCYL